MEMQKLRRTDKESATYPEETLLQEEDEETSQSSDSHLVSCCSRFSGAFINWSYKLILLLKTLFFCLFGSLGQFFALIFVESILFGFLYNQLLKLTGHRMTVDFLYILVCMLLLTLYRLSKWSWLESIQFFCWSTVAFGGGDLFLEYFFDTTISDGLFFLFAVFMIDGPGVILLRLNRTLWEEYFFGQSQKTE